MVTPSNAHTSKCINFRLYIIVFSSWFPPNILGLKRLVFHPLNHGSEFDPMKSKAKAEHVTPLQWSWCCFPWLPVSPAIPWFSKVFFMFNPNAWHGQRIPNKNPNAVCKDSQKKWLYGPCNVVPKYSVDRKLHFRVFRQIAAWPARQALPFQSNKNLVQICSNQQINANNSKQHSQLRLM